MSEKKLNREERRALLFASIAHALVHSFMLILPAVLIPIMNEFNISVTEVGFLGTLSYIMFGLGAIPAGWLTDKFGSRGLVVICLIGSGASSIFIGLSTDLVMLYAGLILLGLFTSIYHPAGLAMISRRIRNIPRALGYHGIFGNIGLAGAPVISGLIAGYGDWRDAYLLFGSLSLLIGIYFYLKPLTKGKLDGNEANHKETRTLFPELIIFYLSSIIFGFVYRGTLTFMPYLFTHKVTLWEGLDPIAVGGIVTAAALFTGMIGQWLGARAAEKYSLTLTSMVLWTMVSTALMFMGATAQYVLVIWAFIFNIFIFAGQPVGNTLLARYSSLKSRGKGYGLNIAIGFGIGSFSSTLSGYVAEKHGIGEVFIFLGIVMIPGIFLAFWLYILGKRREVRELRGSQDSG